MTVRDANVLFFSNPWASGEIRGKQVAERGGWLLDPEGMRRGDIAVFIKQYPNQALLDEMRKLNIPIFVDTVDCYGIIPMLNEFPDITVIAMSRVAREYLESKIDNKIVRIDEHHCNWDNELVNRTELKRIGYVGYGCSFQLPIDVVKDTLKKFDIEFTMLTEFKTRQDIVDYYKTIDLQLCFRLPGTIHNLVPQLRNPLKLANAGSFGIPTIAYPEPSYVDEWDGSFFPIGGLQGLIHWVDEIKRDWEVYAFMRYLAVNRAKQYYIDNVIANYRRVFNACYS